MSNWKPTSAFAKAVYDAGFNYDPTQDIIYSRLHAIQRHFGYGYAYDDYALDVGMIIDCEPICSFEIVKDTILDYSNFYEILLANLIGDFDQWRQTIAHLKDFKLMDFSCSVEMQNKSTIYTLVRNTTHAGHGTYSQPPPDRIAASTTGRFILQDDFGVHGAEGWVTYELRKSNGSSATVKLKYGCPTGAYSNYVEVQPSSPNIRFYARVGDHDWRPVGHVPENGHPLYVQFVIYDH